MQWQNHMQHFKDQRNPPLYKQISILHQRNLIKLLAGPRNQSSFQVPWLQRGQPRKLRIWSYQKRKRMKIFQDEMQMMILQHCMISSNVLWRGKTSRFFQYVMYNVQCTPNMGKVGYGRFFITLLSSVSIPSNNEGIKGKTYLKIKVK